MNKKFIQGICLEASAGSGKTFALVARYLSLLFLGANASSILVLTFTNKAADEMAHKIEEFLLNLPQNDSILKQIEHTSGLTPSDIRSRYEEVKRSFFERNSKIMTIDKFIAQALRLFSTHFGLTPNFSIQMTSKQERIIDFLRHVAAKDKMGELVRVALSEDKRVMSLFELLQELYKVGFALPQAIRENRSELLKHISRLETQLIESCEQIIVQLSQKEPLPDKLVAQFRFDAPEELCKRGWLEKQSLCYWNYKKYFTNHADMLLIEVKSTLKEYFDIKERLFLNGLRELFTEFLKSRKEFAKYTGKLDFDDLSAFGYELFAGEESVDKNFFYFRLDAKIDHILIDEFQDTSTLQFSILRPLIEECVAGIGTKEFKSFFYVGDKKQSIYRFRGANARLFDLVHKQLNLQKDALTTNYRSTPCIVEFVNDVFKERFANYIPQIPKESENLGFVTVCKSEDPIQNVLENIDLLLKAGVKSESIAVLGYTNDDLLQVSDAVRERFEGIKIVTETSSKLIRAASVKPLVWLFSHLYYGDTVSCANFFALIGEEIASVVDTKKILKHQKSGLRAMAIAAINTYSLTVDENIMRFLLLLDDFDDLDEFIYSLDTIDATQALRSMEGLRLLSVHKSKGLEFENVILCDRLTKKRPNTDPLMFEYEGLGIKDIKVRYSGRSLFDEQYKSVYESERAQSEDDERNAHYVAFTRAKDRLFVSAKSQNSAFEGLGLQEGNFGDFNVRSKPQMRKEDAVQKVPFESVAVGRQKLENTKNKEESHDKQAIQAGLAAHYFFEMLFGTDEKSIKYAFWALENRYAPRLSKERYDGLCKKLQNAATDKKFAGLLKYTTLKEQNIRFDGKLKRLDWVMVKDDEVVVIDFKTGGAHSSHKQQLSEYAKAAEALWKRPARAFLGYVGDEFFLESVE